MVAMIEKKMIVMGKKEEGNKEYGKKEEGKKE